MKGINIIRVVVHGDGGAGVTYADTIPALHDWVPDAATRPQIAGEPPMRLYFGA